MAKKAAKSGGAAASRRTDEAEEARLARLAADAMRKQRAGERLNRIDTRAIAAFEAFQRSKFGKDYLSAIPKADVSAFTGRQSKVLLEFAARYGLPYDRHEPTVDGRAWFAFTADLLAAKGRMLAGPGSEEDAILQLASGPLKDELVRKLIEKNEIANERARIELRKAQESYAPVDSMVAYLNELTGLVIQLSESMGRRDAITGAEAQDELADLAAQFGVVAQSMFGNGSSSPEQIDAD
ncbi:MAG: hypothetical protein H0T51_07705 [Pirellulales bacterium]|nr:hypothetical protein [Pirellulales bacterium]